MRGSPPVQLALLLTVFLVRAVPLMQLTTRRQKAEPTASSNAIQASNKIPTQLSLRYAHKPTKLDIQLDGKPLMPELPIGESPVEWSTTINVPKEGVELQVAASWPDGTPDTALTIVMEPDAMDAQSQTRWSTGAQMQETFVFQWKP